MEPTGGDPGYVQWKDAMKMVARLPEGVPSDFRKKVILPAIIMIVNQILIIPLPPSTMFQVVYRYFFVAVVDLIREAFSVSRS